MSDESVARLYAEPTTRALAAHAPVSLHIVPSGEVHKTRETWARVSVPSGPVNVVCLRFVGDINCCLSARC